MPYRILHVGKYYPPTRGGIELFTQALARAQAAHGHEVRALVHGDPTEGDADGHVALHRVPVRGRLLFTPLSPGFRRALRDELRTFAPDVIHVHAPNPSAFWLLSLPAPPDAALVLHWHSDVVPSRIRPTLRLAYAAYRPFEQALLARTDRVIATSTPYLDASEPLRRWRDRCTVVPLGIDPQDYVGDAGEAAAPEWPAPGQRVLAIGRLTYYKGFVDLVHTLAYVPEASLVIVGSGEEEGAIRQAIEQTGAGDRIRLVTDADDAERNEWLRSCDVVCQPSVERTEAFGLVLLEAFAFGRPVIASDLAGSGAPWVVRESGGGLLFPPGDRAALADALRRLAAESGLASSLGSAGAKALRETFRIDAVAAATDQVYAEALASRRSRT